VQSCGNIKYLGIVIDKHLRWDVHLEGLTKRLGKLNFIFKNLKSVLNDSELKGVYISLCQSVIIYGIEIWGGAALTHIQPLNIAQKAILQIMSGADFQSPSEPLFKKYNVMDIRQLYIKRIMGRLYGSPHASPVLGERDTRSLANGLRHVPRMRTALGQRTAEYLAPRMYNRLPIEVRACERVREFAKRLDEWLMTTGRDGSQTELFYTLK
jgi:hypothetical protein